MQIDYKTPLLTGADVCTCKANSVLNDGVCELQYRTDPVSYTHLTLPTNREV